MQNCAARDDDKLGDGSGGSYASISSLDNSACTVQRQKHATQIPMQYCVAPMAMVVFYWLLARTFVSLDTVV